eukprot:TRINITY_DN12244_c0_g1_i1.p1 TRINITY_DN12244_c0_g1~~TRINITY_DN12244_c0_g1_i1.p1  ORF type:complete len:356 (+),score=83.12 TRINITY_DN12244_c0_g1_i1:136-1203(+)
MCIRDRVDVLSRSFSGNSIDASIKSSDSNNYSRLFPSQHVGVVLVGVTVLLALTWTVVIFLCYRSVANGKLEQRNPAVNLQMTWIYIALGVFLFSAEFFGMAPDIRFWNMVPYVVLVFIVLHIEKIFCCPSSDWGFMFCAVPICFLSFCAREAHLMIAGFCFSAMEFVYNAPPTFEKAVDHVCLYALLYTLVVIGMEQFYGTVEAYMNPAPDWRVEFCFVMFVVPFRVPILYRKQCDAAIMLRDNARELELDPKPIPQEEPEREFRSIGVQPGIKLNQSKLTTGSDELNESKATHRTGRVGELMVALTEHQAAQDKPILEPVSYTHLRAHETPEHLVCRLLLEKKKKKAQTSTNS